MDPFAGFANLSIAVLVAAALAVCVGALLVAARAGKPGLDRIERAWLSVPIGLLAGLAWATYVAMAPHG
jgi:hypothetical protein